MEWLHSFVLCSVTSRSTMLTGGLGGLLLATPVQGSRVDERPLGWLMNSELEGLCKEAALA
jgi:hypothetical protein